MKKLLDLFDDLVKENLVRTSKRRCLAASSPHPTPHTPLNRPISVLSPAYTATGTSSTSAQLPGSEVMSEYSYFQKS